MYVLLTTRSPGARSKEWEPTGEPACSIPKTSSKTHLPFGSTVIFLEPNSASQMTGRQERVPERTASPGGVAYTWLETTVLIDTLRFTNHSNRKKNGTGSRQATLWKESELWHPDTRGSNPSSALQPFSECRVVSRPRPHPPPPLSCTMGQDFLAHRANRWAE